MFAIVLVHPEIPPNTGNVIRLAANTGASCTSVEPLGFTLGDRELKRAGLDYHEYTRLEVHRDFAACRASLDAQRPRRWFAFTTRATRTLHENAFAPGRRARVRLRNLGPARRRDRRRSRPIIALRIPMRPGVRSLNLSNAVAVAVYEAWRQCGFR